MACNLRQRIPNVAAPFDRADFLGWWDFGRSASVPDAPVCVSDRNRLTGDMSVLEAGSGHGGCLAASRLRVRQHRLQDLELPRRPRQPIADSSDQEMDVNTPIRGAVGVSFFDRCGRTERVMG